MSLLNNITEAVILPGRDLILGQNVTKHLKFLQNSQWWSIDELEEYQNAKLQILIRHAYDNVPYYNEIFKKLKIKPCDIKTKHDLQKLPILTKEDMRTHLPKMIARNFPKKKRLLRLSSGSTGEPMQYYITKESNSMSLATHLRGWYWMGYRFGDKFIKLSVMPRSEIDKKVQDFFIRCSFVDSKGVTEEDIIKIIKRIIDFKPKILRGYPSTISVIAEYIIQNSIHDVKLDIVTTTGEIHFPEMREQISEAFNCEVYDAYAGEGSANIFECSTHQCYHLSSEYAITELLSSTGDIINSGRGDLITTDLWNFAMPMIRYDIKDIVTMNTIKCSCGRGLPTVDKIEGRDVDILIMPSGKRLIVHFFTGYFQKLSSIKQFQILQVSFNSLLIKLVTTSTFNSKIEKSILKDIQDYIGDDVKLNVQKVNEIPLTKAGKRRFVLKSF